MLRTLPMEVMVKGDKVPVYGETLEELGRWVQGAPGGWGLPWGLLVT